MQRIKPREPRRRKFEIAAPREQSPCARHRRRSARSPTARRKTRPTDIPCPPAGRTIWRRDSHAPRRNGRARGSAAGTRERPRSALISPGLTEGIAMDPHCHGPAGPRHSWPVRIGVRPCCCHLQSALGIVVILRRAWLLSENRRAFPVHTVAVGFLLQVGLALLLLKWRPRATRSSRSTVLSMR